MGRIRRVGVVGAIMALALALVLAACGGGGGSGSGTAGGSASTGGTERAGGGSPGEGVPATGSAAAAKEAVLREEVSSSEMFFAGEGGPFCQQFTDRGRQRFLGEIAKSLGVRAPCAKVMSGLAAEIGPPIKTLEREVGELTVADVTIHGSAATVALPANAPVTLDESGGRWYLTRGP
jgi:hypothetical protein